MRFPKLRTLFLAATLAVLPRVDSALALGIKSVGSVERGAVTQVTVVFDATVNLESAQNLANYTLAGATIQSATVMTGLPAADAPGNVDNVPVNGRVVDNQCVVLAVNGVLNGAQTLTIQGVEGADGSILPETVRQFTPSGYKWAEVGVPAKPSQVIAVGTDGFDIYSNGRAMWNVYDEGVLVYKELDGDFDVAVRVEFQDTSSVWARAGVMMREALNEGQDRSVQTGDIENGIEGTAARLVNLRANPTRSFNNDPAPMLIAGNNSYESIYRSETAGTYTGPGGGVPEYPNAWTRIQRQGDFVTTYRSNDGQEWTEMSSLDGWSGPFFVGPSYFPETDNINGAYPEARGRLFLAQLRFNEITTPLVRNVAGTPSGFTFQIQDALTATLNAASLRTTWDGVVVTPAVSKNDTITTVTYFGPQLYAPGSQHTLLIEYSDSNGVPSRTSTGVETPNYATIPPAYRVASATTRGINVSAYQMEAPRGPGDANSTSNAEQQWSRGFLDEAGQPWVNLAAPDQGVVNVVNTLDNGTNDGNFPDGEWTVGIFDGAAGRFVVQYWGYLELNAGVYRLGVNSDDGFKFTMFSAAQDPFGTVVGEFNGGRGPADSLFDLVITEPGFYPYRLLYWQGNGGSGDGAACEWFSVDASGTFILVNDPSNPNALRSFTTASGTAYVESLLPAQGYTGAPPEGPVKIVLRNGTTTVDAASITLELDGATVTPNVSSAGGATTVTYAPAPAWGFNTRHTGTFSYRVTGDTAIRMIPLDFIVKGLSPDDLPATSLWIEAEDYNYQSGQTVAEASIFPYYGGAYDGLPATLNVDYFNLDENDSNIYRPEEAPNNVNLGSDLTGRYTAIRPGGVEMFVNYRIGWVADGDWCNYTRNIPPGTYNVYAALSFDGTAAGQLRGTLARVTSDPSQPNQTLQQIGTFNAPGSGGWGQNDLVPMRAADGTEGILKVTGTAPTTLRFTMGSGDFDYLILSPTDGVPPKITQATPNQTIVPRNQGAVTIEITDFSTEVVPATVKFIFNGADQTAAAVVNKVADVTTVTYNPGVLPANTTVEYSVDFQDTGGLFQNFNGRYSTSVLGTEGQFLIEAEDFNSSGTAVAAASTMPYTGGDYAGLPGVNLVDYTSDGPADIPPDGQVYRAPLNPVLPINANNGDLNRGLWNMTVNYKIGWADAADWCNYTRNFPEGSYEVWAALSHGETGADQIRASLLLVTSDATQPGQTTQPLGSFSASGSGGWGSNVLVPMVDSTGQRIVVPMGGTQTVRFQMDSGDFDYMIFIPSAAPPPLPTISVTTDASGNVIITYTGTLLGAPAINVNFAPVPGAGSPYTVPAGGDQQYFRASN
ncbi:MAG: hypothetical protein KF791_20255 [Verrucomicrobiae bacterium]|nr:hypothetical protein [Verrucomicrobiae bacterium]